MLGKPPRVRPDAYRVEREETDFDAMRDEGVDLLRRRQRVTERALTHPFDLDDNDIDRR